MASSSRGDARALTFGGEAEIAVQPQRAATTERHSSQEAWVTWMSAGISSPRPSHYLVDPATLSDPMVEISITHARDLDSFDGSVKYAETFSMLRSIISVSLADGFACSLRRMPLSALRRMTPLVRLAGDGPAARRCQPRGPTANVWHPPAPQARTQTNVDVGIVPGQW